MRVGELREQMRAAAPAIPKRRTDQWPIEMESTLEKLWKDGMSAKNIGERIGKTKNAVLGKAHRLALDGHPQAAASRVANKPRCKRKLARRADAPIPALRAPQQPQFLVEPLPSPTGEVGTIPFANADHRHCLWIPADPREDSRVCGKPRVRGTSWCEDHLRRATGSPQPRRPVPVPVKQEEAAA